MENKFATYMSLIEGASVVQYEENNEVVHVLINIDKSLGYDPQIVSNMDDILMDGSDEHLVGVSVSTVPDNRLSNTCNTNSFDTIIGHSKQQSQQKIKEFHT